MFSAVVIGCGDRAATYCEAAVHLLGEISISTTDIADSINGHLVCCAADKAMHENAVQVLHLN